MGEVNATIASFMCFNRLKVVCFFFLFFFARRVLMDFQVPSMKFSVYFMGYEKAEDIPTDRVERAKWTMGRPGTIELTQ